MANNTNQPMYRKIKEELLHRISSGLLLPGDRLPTEYQLMEQYQVSRITVSKALSELKSEGVIDRFPNRGSFVAQQQKTSQTTGIRWETLFQTAEGRQEILSQTAEAGQEIWSQTAEAGQETWSQTAEAGQKTFSQTAGIRLPGKNTQTHELLPEIACIIPTVTDLFSLTMVNGVLSAFPQNEYICHIFHSRNPQIENYLLKRCLETGISGIVLFPQDQPYFSNELLFMNLHNYPLVLLDRYLPRLNTSYVIADNKKAGELCLRHLHQLGHQRIAFITSSGRDTFSVKYRLEGIQNTAEELNMPESAVHVIDHWNINHEVSHYQEMFLKLVNEDKITAFIAAECNTCTYLYNLCAFLKLDVPGRVSLLSFDKPAAETRNPNFFTHINQSEFLMGKEAGSLLRQRLEENDMNIYHKVITPSLEIRQSTASVVF